MDSPDYRPPGYYGQTPRVRHKLCGELMLSKDERESKSWNGIFDDMRTCECPEGSDPEITDFEGRPIKTESGE